MPLSVLADRPRAQCIARQIHLLLFLSPLLAYRISLLVFSAPEK